MNKCYEAVSYTHLSMPSLLNGQLGDSIKESFDRFRFGGQTPQKQQVFFVNLQEIKGIKFGTRQPINYFDSFYNAELFLRAHGTYSIKIVDPLDVYKRQVKMWNQVFGWKHSGPELEQMAQKIEYPVRKAAHMSEYAVLALLIFQALTVFDRKKNRGCMALGITAAYAVTDEFHQLFVPGRAGRVTDVLIDSAGAFLALDVYKRQRQRHGRKHSMCSIRLTSTAGMCRCPSSWTGRQGQTSV